MQIELSEEQLLLRETVRRFANEVVAPRARQIDASGEFPLDFFHRAGEMGLAGVCVQEGDGGGGMDAIAYCIVIEEISKVCASSGVILSVNNSLVCDPLLQFADEAQKREFLFPLAAGAKLGCFALTEPEAGSDAGALRTTARRDGDAYVLDGSKVFITNGTHADLALVFATVDPEKKHRGIACFLVDTDDPGFSSQEIHGKMGLHGSDTAELALDEVTCTDDQMLGEVGDGFKIAMSSLDSGRYSVAAGCVGICQGCVDHSVAYAKERNQFGKPIASFQLVQAMIAEMIVKRDAARMLVFRAGDLKDRGQPSTVETSIAKLYATESAVECANAAIQVHGGSGYVDDYPVERYLRDARVTTLYEGTSQIQKLIIGRDATGINALVPPSND